MERKAMKHCVYVTWIQTKAQSHPLFLPSFIRCSEHLLSAYCVPETQRCTGENLRPWGDSLSPLLHQLWVQFTRHSSGIYCTSDPGEAEE